MENKIKVLVLQPRSMSGVGWYRIEQLKKYSKHEIYYLSGAVLGSNDLMQVIDAADVYFVRLSDTNAFYLMDAIKAATKKRPVILDTDDNYDLVDPLSDMYKVYGKKEVFYDATTKLWEDGKNFSIAKNTERLNKFHDLMSSVSMVTVTTEILRKYAEQFNDNVSIIPNAIDFNLFPHVKADKGNEIRILWAGGASHYKDMVEIQLQLKQIMEQNPQVHFYMLGVPFEGIIKDLPKNRVHAMGWVTADGHGYRLACINADIGIAPLIDSEFNKYKSSIKYYEYSALGMPTVARNIPPYSVDIVHGKNGMLYNTPEDFRILLQALIDNPLKRIEMGQKAFNYVKDHSIQNSVKTWDKMVSRLVRVYKNFDKK